MAESHRALARRSSLATLILLPMLLLPLASGIARASGPGTPEPLSKDTYRMLVDSKDAAKGFTLIAPYNGYRANLVDYAGRTVHTWQSDRTSLGTVMMLDDGTLLRGRSGANGQPSGLHRLDWDGTVLWDYLGHAWKISYHTVRCIVQCIRRLRVLVGE